MKAARAAGEVLGAVACGELTPSEGAHVMALIETYRRTLETTELEQRISALEASPGGVRVELAPRQVTDFTD